MPSPRQLASAPAATAIAASFLVPFVVAPPASAGHGAPSAAPGPRFETRFADSERRPVGGRQTLRVGKDPVSRKPGVFVAVRAVESGRTLLFDTVPGTVTWDTTLAPDGWQTLQVVLIDTGSERPSVCDTLRVFVRNGQAVARAAPGAAPGAARTALSSRAGRSAGARRGRQAPVPVLPERILPTPVDATVAGSERPFSEPATVLFRAGDRVILGLPDGGVALCDTGGEGGKTVRLRESPGPVRALTASADGKMVFWLAGAGDRVFCYRDSDGRVVSFDAADPALAGAPWVERLTVVGGRVALLGEGAAWFLEPEGGALTTASSVLPPSIAGPGARLFLAADGDRDVLAVSVSPAPAGSSVRVWSAPRLSTEAGDWSDRGELATRVGFSPAVATSGRTFGAGDAHASVATRVFGGPAPLSLTPYGYALIDGDGRGVSAVQVGLARSADGAAPFAPRPLPVVIDDNPNAPQRPRRVALGGSGVWWEEGGIVQRTDPATGRREAYLPWNGAGLDVRALSADRDSLWVATDKGVRRIHPDNPTEEDGYGGYVRIALGPESAQPPSDRDALLAGLVEEWQGVPYKWSGQTKAGTDCSGFVMSVHGALGVNVPRTSKAMGTTAQGRRVRDELCYGDVLVFPGHVALYIGNGRTAETVGGSNGQSGGVGKASVWRRRDVVVKRFLP